MFLVRLAERADHVNRFAVFLKVVPDTLGNRFMQFAPKSFDPLPILCTQQRKQQFAADRQRDQFGR